MQGDRVLYLGTSRGFCTFRSTCPGARLVQTLERLRGYSRARLVIGAQFGELDNKWELADYAYMLTCIYPNEVTIEVEHE